MDLLSIINEVDFYDNIRTLVDLWITGQWRLERKRAKECVTYRNFRFIKRYYVLNYSINILKTFLIDNFKSCLEDRSYRPTIKEACEYLKIIYGQGSIDRAIKDDILLALFKSYCYSISIVLHETLSCLDNIDCRYVFTELTMGEYDEINRNITLDFLKDIRTHYLNDNYIFELGSEMITILDVRCNKLNLTDFEEQEKDED